MSMNTVFALCANRHEELAGIPALFPQGFFDNQVDMFDYERMEVQLHFVLNQLLEARTTELPWLFVYVTGYTPAMLAVVNFCQLYNIPLTALHWDKRSKQYVPQYVGIDDDRNSGHNYWALYRDGNIDDLLAYISGNITGDTYELEEAGLYSGWHEENRY